MIDELPLSDELDRKAIEALIRIADEQSHSLMSEREARLAIRAVFESVQGLVGEEVGEAINVAMSQFNSGTKRYGSVRIRLPGDQSNPDPQHINGRMARAGRLRKWRGRTEKGCSVCAWRTAERREEAVRSTNDHDCRWRRY